MLISYVRLALNQERTRADTIGPCHNRRALYIRVLPHRKKAWGKSFVLGSHGCIVRAVRHSVRTLFPAAAWKQERSMNPGHGPMTSTGNTFHSIAGRAVRAPAAASVCAGHGT